MVPLNHITNSVNTAKNYTVICKLLSEIEVSLLYHNLLQNFEFNEFGMVKNLKSMASDYSEVKLGLQKKHIYYQLIYN